MPITGGFGNRFDLETGGARAWYMGRDGVQRWADNDSPCNPTLSEATDDGQEGNADA